MSILVILVFGISLLSCSSQMKSSTNNKGTEQTTASSSSQGKSESQQDKQKENTTVNKDKLTIEDIKAKYTGGDNGQIVNVTTYEPTTINHNSYVLVEYMNVGGRHCYDWYNLVTGDKDVLPVSNYNCKLKKIIDQDDIVFTTDGVFAPTGEKYFPEIIECNRVQEVIGSENDFYQVLGDLYLSIDQGFNMGNRVQEVIGSENDFYQVLGDLYLSIDQGFNMGSRAYETIRDIRVSLEGVEVLFGPMKGHEVDFYSGAGGPVPNTKTSYNKAKNQFIIEFMNTSIGNEFDKSKTNKQDNRFINSISFKNNGSNTILTVNLKAISKYYTIENLHLEITTDCFPYLDFNFADNYNAR